MAFSRIDRNKYLVDIVVDLSFSNGCMDSVNPAEVYNCCCSMVVFIEGITDIDDTEKDRQSFSDWLADKVFTATAVGSIINMNLQYFAKGRERAEKFADNWVSANLDDTVERFVPNAETRNTDTGKIIYYSDGSDYEVCYDIEGDYFRLSSNLLHGKRKYLDINGNNVANITINGKTRGRTKDEYESLTHFKNIKKGE